MPSMRNEVRSRSDRRESREAKRSPDEYRGRLTGRKVGIVGTGSYLPEKVLTNFDLEKMVETSDEWIRTRTGIRERHIVDNGRASSDLAVVAAQRALKKSKLTPGDLDLIIVGTITPDRLFPSTACYVQHKLGARQIPAFDLSAACSGFLYVITIGSSFIANGIYKNVLAIGVETMSTITDYTDRNTCVLFGDGAGATILQPIEEGHQILYTYLGADGAGGDLMILPASGSQIPTSHKTVDERLHLIKLRGREVFKYAVLKMTEIIRDALVKTNYTLDDISLIIPHQMNRRILEATAEKLDIPIERIFINIDRCANTSGASIPMAFDEAVQTGRIKKGDVVIMVAFGGGLTWGTTVIKW